MSGALRLLRISFAIVFEARGAVERIEVLGVVARDQEMVWRRLERAGLAIVVGEAGARRAVSLGRDDLVVAEVVVDDAGDVW